MNIKGSHFKVSASTFGLVGFRPIDSKKILYRFMNELRFILYLVQLSSAATLRGGLLPTLYHCRQRDHTLDSRKVQLHQTICHPSTWHTGDQPFKMAFGDSTLFMSRQDLFEFGILLQAETDQSALSQAPAKARAPWMSGVIHIRGEQSRRWRLVRHDLSRRIGGER